MGDVDVEDGDQMIVLYDDYYVSDVDGFYRDDDDDVVEKVKLVKLLQKEKLDIKFE